MIIKCDEGELTEKLMAILDQLEQLGNRIPGNLHVAKIAGAMSDLSSFLTAHQQEETIAEVDEKINEQLRHSSDSTVSAIFDGKV